MKQELIVIQNVIVNKLTILSTAVLLGGLFGHTQVSMAEPSQQPGRLKIEEGKIRTFRAKVQGWDTAERTRSLIYNGSAFLANCGVGVAETGVTAVASSLPGTSLLANFLVSEADLAREPEERINVKGAIFEVEPDSTSGNLEIYSGYNLGGIFELMRQYIETALRAAAGMTVDRTQAEELDEDFREGISRLLSATERSSIENLGVGSKCRLVLRKLIVLTE